ncbi:MAG TPA: hypothetical protein VEU06_00085 [Micropepsaceae bacterium]|nr:hypothetical protein [Micropepsaceae bacterium]
MRTDLVHPRRLRDEAENSVSGGEFPDDPPRAGELCFQAGLALAIPLALAIIANLVLIACGLSGA